MNIYEFLSLVVIVIFTYRVIELIIYSINFMKASDETKKILLNTSVVKIMKPNSEKTETKIK